MYESDSDLEDVFKLVTIDKRRKKRITVRLVDEDGSEVPFRETVEAVVKFIEGKMSSKDDEANQMINQIFPLCTQAMCAALPRVAGEHRAISMMSIDAIRWPLINMMLLSFSLLKFVQQKSIKIVTVEEDITDEEMEKVLRFSEASEAATLGALNGMNPKDVLKEMVQQGRLSAADVKELTAGKMDISDDLKLPDLADEDDEEDPDSGPTEPMN